MDRIPGFCFCGRKSENLRDKDDPRCSTCKKAERVYEAKELVAKEKAEMRRIDIRLKGGVQGKPIKKVSAKLAYYLTRYTPIKAEFLKKNRKCVVYPERKSVDVHHAKGRSYLTFEDQWAKDNDIPLLLDARFFIAVSRDGHNWIEANPDAAKEKGWSLNRL